MDIISKTLHTPDPEYLRELIRKSGLSQRECARQIGVRYSTMRDYLNSKHASEAPYAVQAQLESLSRQYNGYFIDMPLRPSDVKQVEALLDNQAYLKENDFGEYNGGFRLYLLFDRNIHIDNLHQIVSSLGIGEYQVTPMNVVGTIKIN